MEQRKKTVSCGGLPYRIRNDRVEVLLVKQLQHQSSWGIPKGHMNPGETYEQCALREIREETGVQVKLGLRLPDCNTRSKNEDKTVVSYLATPIGNHEPTHDDPDNEIVDSRWICVDNLPKIHVYQQFLITKAIELLQECMKVEFDLSQGN